MTTDRAAAGPPFTRCQRGWLGWVVCILVPVFVFQSHAGYTQQASEGMTALHRAAQEGPLDEVRHLIKAGLKINARTSRGETPLVLAVMRRRVSVVSVLLDAGADPGLADQDGRTPLHFAAAVGDVQLVSLLSSYGARTDALDHEGATPLHAAVCTTGRLPVVRWLVDHGADVSRPMVGNVTPLLIGVYVGDADVVRFLLSHGADLSARSTPEYGGQTALTAALDARHISMAETLIQAGARETFQNDPRAATLIELVQAQASGDSKHFTEVVLRSGHLALALESMYLDEALELRARGVSDPAQLERVRRIATVQAESSDSDGLLRMIQRYSEMTTAELMERQSAIATLAQARDALTQGDLAAAQQLAEKALVTFDKLDDSLSQLSTFGYLAQVHAKAARRDAADLYVRKVYQVLSEFGYAVGDPEYLVLGTSTRLTSDSPAGPKDAQRFGYVVDELDPPLDDAAAAPDGEQESRSARAVALAREGNYPEALREYRALLDSPSRLNDAEHAHALLGAARAARAQWQLSRAAYLFGGAAHELSQIGARQAALAAQLELADLNWQFGRVEEAVAGYMNAATSASDLESNPWSVTLNARLGNLFSNQGNLPRALEYYEVALIGAHAMSPGGLEEAAVLMNLGTVYARAGRPGEAQHYYQPVLELALKQQDRSLEAAVRLNLALVLHDGGNDANAWDQIDALQGNQQTSIDPELAWRYERACALILQATGRLEDAAPWYNRSILRLEAIHSRGAELDPSARSHLFDQRRFVYREFVDLLVALAVRHPEAGYPARLFELSEQVKSRIFTDMVALASAQHSAQVPAGLLEAEQNERLKVVRLRQDLVESLRQPRGERDEQRIESLRAELQSAVARQQAQEAATGSANAATPGMPSVSDTQHTLRAGEVVVSYVLGLQTASALVLTRERLRFVPLLTNPAELADLVSGFRSGLDRVVDWQDLESFDPVLAYRLYEKLLKPLESYLPKDSRIFICGDEQIYSVPVEALVDQPLTAEEFARLRERARRGTGDYLSEYAGLHYVIDSYTVRYLPSVTVLELLRAKRNRQTFAWKRPLVAFGDPVFLERPPSSDAASVKPPIVLQRGDSLVLSEPKAPIVIAEQHSIRDLVGALFKGINVQLKRGDRVLAEDLAGTELFNAMAWTPDIETQFFSDALANATGRQSLASLRDTNEEVRLVAAKIGAGEADLFLRERASKANLFGLDLRGTRYLLFATHGFLGGDFTGGAEPALALSRVGNAEDGGGLLTMSEIAALNLDSELVVLSACDTAGSDRKAVGGEGFAGLTRSFMGAGASALLVSHWSVDSQAARDLVVAFFGLKSSLTSAEALRRAKLDIKRQTRYTGKGKSGLAISQSHPFFWAPFVFVGDDSDAAIH